MANNVINTPDDLEFYMSRINHETAVRLLVETGRILGVCVICNEVNNTIQQVPFEAGRVKCAAEKYHKISCVIKDCIA